MVSDGHTDKAVCAAIHKYEVIYTSDIRKKQKVFNDGYLNVHKFNNMAILYNEHMVEEARDFIGANAFYDKGDTVRCERYLVEIDCQLETQYQDLSPLYDRSRNTPTVPPRNHIRSSAERHETTPRPVSITPRKAQGGPLLNLGSPPTMLDSTHKRPATSTKGPSLGPKKIRQKVIEKSWPHNVVNSRPTVPRTVNRTFRPPDPPAPKPPPPRFIENLSNGLSERIVVEEESQESVSLGSPTGTIEQNYMDLDEINFSSEDEIVPTTKPVDTDVMLDIPDDLDIISIIDEELKESSVPANEEKASSESEISSSFEVMETSKVSPKNITIPEPPVVLQVHQDLPPLKKDTPQTATKDDVSMFMKTPPTFPFSPSLAGLSARKPFLCLSRKPDAKRSKSASDQLKRPGPSPDKVIHPAPSLAQSSSSLSNDDMLVQKDSPPIEHITSSPPPVLKKTETAKCVSEPSAHKSRKLLSSSMEKGETRSSFKLDVNSVNPTSVTKSVEPEKPVPTEEPDAVIDLADDLEIELSQVIEEITLTQAAINSSSKDSDEEEEEEEPKELTAPMPSSDKAQTVTNNDAQLPSTDRPPLGAPPTKRRYVRSTTMAPSKHPQYTMPVPLDPATGTRATRESSMGDNPADPTNTSTISITEFGPWTEETLDLFAWRPKALSSNKT